MGEGTAIDHERGPFFGLLLTQLVFIALTPFVGDTGQGRMFLYIGVFSIMVAGCYASIKRRSALIGSIILLAIATGAWLGPDVFPGRVDEVLRLASTGLAFSFTAIVVVVAIGQHKRVTTETILGGVNSYLLIAFAFMMFHATVMELEPSAYTVGGVPLRDQLRSTADSHGFATMLYFSFTTLTTLGYGDLVPVTALARLMTSGEAVLGQLYVAVFIARLVSLEVSQRAGEGPNGNAG